MVDGWGTGGATQYEFSLSVQQLEGIGLLKAINIEEKKKWKEVKQWKLFKMKN